MDTSNPYTPPPDSSTADIQPDLPIGFYLDPPTEDGPIPLIQRPKGQAGRASNGNKAGFRLINAMRLDQDLLTYRAVQVTVQKFAAELLQEVHAWSDLERSMDLSHTLGAFKTKAIAQYSFLQHFEDAWPINELIKQFLANTNKRKRATNGPVQLDPGIPSHNNNPTLNNKTRSDEHDAVPELIKRPMGQSGRKGTTAKPGFLLRNVLKLNLKEHGINSKSLQIMVEGFAQKSLPNLRDWTQLKRSPRLSNLFMLFKKETVGQFRALQRYENAWPIDEALKHYLNHRYRRHTNIPAKPRKPIAR